MPVPPRLSRALSLALAFATLVAVAGLAVLGFQEKAASFQPLGVELVAEGGGYRVLEARASTGLEAGDLVLLVAGDTPLSLADLSQRLRARDSEVVVQRGGGLEQVGYTRPPLAVDWPYLVLGAIGLFYLLVGAYTGLHAVRRRRANPAGSDSDGVPLSAAAAESAAWASEARVSEARASEARVSEARASGVSDSPTALFFAWCLTSAALFLLSPVWPPTGGIGRSIYLVDQAARVLLPALTLHFFLLFPTPLASLGPGGRWRRLLPALYLPGALQVAFHVDQALAGGRWIFGAATAAQVRAIDRLELIVLVSSALLSAFVLWLRLDRRPQWQDRRRLQWIVAGMVMGWMPFLLFYLLPYTFGQTPPLGLALLAIVPLALVPLTFAWAIFKYRLLDMGPMLRDVVSFSAAAMVAIVGFQLAQLAIRAGLGDGASLGRSALTFGAGLAMAGVMVPTRDAISTTLERLRWGGRLGSRRMLRDLGRELLHERDIDRLCHTLADHLETGLDVRAVLFLAADEGSLVPMRPAPDLPRSLSRRALDGAFGASFWGRTVASVSPVGLPSADSEPADDLARTLALAGLHYAFPITVRDTPVALAVLGYRNDDEPLSSEDVDLVRHLLDQAALAIENARLLDDLRQRLREVEQLEAYSEGILHSSPAGIAVLDQDGRVQSANHSFAALCGLERSALQGRPIEEVVPVWPLPEAGDGALEVGWCEAEGEERHLQLSVDRYRTAPTARALDGSSADEAVLGTARAERVLVLIDIGERVTMAAELQQKDRLASLGMLAAGVAHEVNTPLTGISSYAQLLIDDTAEDDPRRELLRKVERQTFRAAQIVNNLLEFARDRRASMEKVALRSVVDEALGLLAERAEAQRIEILRDPRSVASSDPYWVLGSESELHQVLTNLVVNAIDAIDDPAAPAASVRRVTVGLDRRACRVLLEVRDTGPGIAPERLETVFEPFFSSKVGRGGSGLGLAICRNIARRHGGDLRARVEPEGGCVFTLELPAHPCDRDYRPEDLTASSPSAKSAHRADWAG